MYRGSLFGSGYAAFQCVGSYVFYAAQHSLAVSARVALRHNGLP